MLKKPASDEAKCLALFDFDGTITDRDSMLDFIMFGIGLRGFCAGFISLLPALALYKLRIIPNFKAKEIVLTKFFRGWDIERFDQIAASYSEKIPRIVRRTAMEKLRWHKLSGHTVVVVSASIEHYLKYWCAREGFEVIATRLEVHAGALTGRLSGKNCHGYEKVRRIRERFDLESYDLIYAYGDSSGDKEMLEAADERYFRWKRIGR